MRCKITVKRTFAATVAALLIPALLAACTPAASPSVASPSGAPQATTPRPTATPAPSPTPAPKPVTVAMAGLPETYAEPLRAALAAIPSVADGGAERPVAVVDAADQATVRLALVPLPVAQNPLAERFYAVVVPFPTITDDIALDDLRGRWAGVSSQGILYVTQDAADDLAAVLGTERTAEVVPAEEMLARLEAAPQAVGIVPFDRLDPRFKVLTVDGVNVLDNHLDAKTYPLAVGVAVEGPDAALLADRLADAIRPATNRDPAKLTTLIMTGVTAMTRMTALKMEQHGYTYPAEIISATLRAADITHVSNEVPFIPGCKVDPTPGNLTMCSDTTYWAALEAIGTDIVGLSGNHVNDFGTEGARTSLTWYREHGIPIYGSGMNAAEACAPLMWEHNGNTFAFIAALAFDPWYAWATDTEPGACYYYDHKEEILKKVAELSQKVDIVAVELQYYETYNPYPTDKQVEEFRELRAAGADIVTGVQSHVPQAMEPYGASEPGGPGIIVYGLGNLFFDQMWSWETRTELYARHTIYDGRLLSTEILTGVLEDYAQPRWATPEERAGILKSIFDAAPKR